MAANDASKGIEYSGISELNIGLGSAVDILTVASTHGTTTNIDGNAGGDIFNLQNHRRPDTVNGNADSDTFNVGSGAAGTTGNKSFFNSGGTLNQIAGDLRINGHAPTGNSDVLNVDDSGDAAANTGDKMPAT